MGAVPSAGPASDGSSEKSSYLYQPLPAKPMTMFCGAAPGRGDGSKVVEKGRLVGDQGLREDVVGRISLAGAGRATHAKGGGDEDKSKGTSSRSVRVVVRGRNCLQR